ncbi:right-handed parallel beta-helix repeat-containing protein [Actinomadura verrucosospora]|uniref:Sortase-sorted surface protein n=1 Tax=Actinomadura verrucosospora TaxID=46165 RepID=A0A7D4A5H8_ACTVE|nr:right-handed parallel beta-helix repeat-containing protein [Actinomadura verrucosospora]QKG23085.1 sortase-sorted surface protein [Actinomadura verrucosospora]
MGSTAYPVPAGALFVAPSGDDNAAGTLREPLRTLGAAVAKAPVQGTIVLRGGTYHESVKVPAGRKLTIQSASHEAVWLDGSSPVTGWRQENGAWVHDGWTARFDASPTYTSGAAPSDDPDFQFVSPDHPMAAHPDQLWIDGSPQTQAASRAEVRPGTFYVDEAAQRLYLGGDPRGHDVRASTLGHAIVLRAGRSTLRGIGIRRYATSLPELGSLRISGPNVTVENVVVDGSATAGLSVNGPGARIRHVTTSGNGMLGVLGHEADDLRLESVRTERNNLEHFKYAPVSGGIKITRSRRVALVGSVAADNLGKGVWLDESVYDATLTGNRILRNASHGVVLELSAKAVVTLSVISGNGDDGLKVNNTSDVRIEGNALTGNGRTIDLAQDPRSPDHPGATGLDPRHPGDPAMTWRIEKITVRGNTLATPRPGTPCLLCVDHVARNGPAGAAEIALDGNVYRRSDSSTPRSLIVWTDRAGVTSQFPDLARFRSATGQEKHGRLDNT